MTRDEERRDRICLTTLATLAAAFLFPGTGDSNTGATGATRAP